MNPSRIQLILALILLTSLTFMVMEIITTWQLCADITVAPVTKKKKKSGPRHKQKKISFYPSVPSPMPDLYDGYLFNEERHLADPEEKVEEDIAEEGVDLDLDAVMYTGSIIIGNMVKGLITYPEPQQKIVKPRNYRNKSRKKTRLPLDKKRVSKTVQPGDVVGGFRISSIVPEKIVFIKGKEQIEKMLYDSEKKRIVVPKALPRPRQTVKSKATVSKRKRVTSTSRKPVKNRKVVRSR